MPRRRRKSKNTATPTPQNLPDILGPNEALGSNDRPGPNDTLGSDDIASSSGTVNPGTTHDRYGRHEMPDYYDMPHFYDMIESYGTYIFPQDLPETSPQTSQQGHPPWAPFQFRPTLGPAPPPTLSPSAKRRLRRKACGARRLEDQDDSFYGSFSPGSKGRFGRGRGNVKPGFRGGFGRGRGGPPPLFRGGFGGGRGSFSSVLQDGLGRGRGGSTPWSTGGFGRGRGSFSSVLQDGLGGGRVRSKHELLNVLGGSGRGTGSSNPRSIDGPGSWDDSAPLGDSGSWGDPDPPDDEAWDCPGIALPETPRARTPTQSIPDGPRSCDCPKAPPALSGPLLAAIEWVWELEQNTETAENLGKTPISEPLDPSNLGKVAEHASLMLDVFSRVKPVDDHQITVVQKKLITTALTSVLGITRQLRVLTVGANEPLEPLPDAHDDTLNVYSGCVVCLARVADMLLMPCRHLTLCEVCCGELDEIQARVRGAARAGPMRCPVCRADVLDRIKIYRS